MPFALLHVAPAQHTLYSVNGAVVNFDLWLRTIDGTTPGRLAPWLEERTVEYRMYSPLCWQL